MAARAFLSDKTGLELQDLRETSVKGRKKLAESTKEFRRRYAQPEAADPSEAPEGRQPTVEIFDTAKELLRSYQEEIDKLTRRARAADGAFFALYKSLYEAPDPAPALAESLSSRSGSAASALEVQRLRGEIAAYDAEFATLKNQDITIRHLTAQLEELEERMEVRFKCACVSACMLLCCKRSPASRLERGAGMRGEARRSEEIISVR